MQHRTLAVLIAACLGVSQAWGASPVFHTNACSVSVDNNRLDTVLTPGGADQRNTFAYEPSRHLWHFWGFLQDDISFEQNDNPTVLSSLRSVVHATSTDGIHFTSDSNLSYAFGSASYTSYGATVDPPLDFFRAVYDTQTGTWKLFNWSENDYTVSPSRWGSYDYNTSVNDLGTIASTTNVVHQGPLNSPVSGNHVGTFGLVDGMLYLRADTDGGADQFAYTDGAYPWTGANQPSTGSEISSANLFAGTPYCWGLSASCDPNTDPNAAYVHNVGRTLLQPDGTLGTYYTFRYWNGSRADQQIWYAESGDNGATWSTSIGVFPNASALTIDGQAQDSTVGSADFSDVDLVLNGSRYQLYLSTQDANGNYVMVSTQGRPSDDIFFDGFDSCD